MSMRDHLVPMVPPLSVAAAMRDAESFLLRWSPHVLVDPCPLDIPFLIDKVLHKEEIFVCPARDEELEGTYGRTLLTEDDETQILLRVNLYDAIYEGGKHELFARSTFAHELGHARLHLPQLRAMKRRLAVVGMTHVNNPAAALHRKRRADIKAYEDPEWQAWAWAGCLLAPPSSMRQLSPMSLWDAASTFKISESMMRRHVERLGRAGIHVLTPVH